MRSRARRRRDVQGTLAGLLLGLLAAMMALSLATHSPRDLGPDWRSTPQPENASGIVGAYVSGALFRILGPFGAWLAPIAVAVWSVNSVRGASWRTPARRCLISGAFVLVVLSLVSTVEGAGPVRWGGAAGDYLGGLASKAFGSLGAHLFLWALLLVLTFIISDLPIRLLALLGELLGWCARTAGRSLARVPGIVGEKLAARRRARRRPKVIRRAAAGAEQRRPEPGEEIEEEPEERPRVVANSRAFSPSQRGGAEEPAPSSGGESVALAEETEGEPGEVERPACASPYELPALPLLRSPEIMRGGVRESEVIESSKTLQEALSHFGVTGRVAEVHPGPVITRYDFEPAAGVRVNQIISRQDDISLALRCQNIRIVAPIPGKAAVGIEVPNKSPQMVYLKELVSDAGFRDSNSKLLVALGKTVAGDPYYADLGTMPHLLIAGATGSGKSVCVNSIIMSLLYRLTADELKLLLIDPKRLELSGYNGIPHLLLPVVTDHKKAAGALRWVLSEMDRRYKHLAGAGVRDIASYNARAAGDPAAALKQLPLLVIVVDELSDLMLALPAEIEEPVTRLAQMARAVGIHLILATQRPSVDVITGLIKANFPSRIAFQVAAKVDSRTILDTNGAECLLGRGDMLFLPGGTPQPVRIHGAYVSPDETAAVTGFLRSQVSSEEEDVPELDMVEGRWGEAAGDEQIFKEAAKLVVLHQQGSTSLLQRRLRIGYSRAARIVDLLEERGIVGPFKGSKAREVLVDEEYLKEHRLM